MKRKIRALLWILIVGAVGSHEGRAQDATSDIAQKYSGTIVYIEATFARPETHTTDTRNGIGFIITPNGHVLTTSHVVDPKQGEDLVRVTGRVGSKVAPEYELVSIIPNLFQDVQAKDGVGLLQLPQLDSPWKFVKVSPQPPPPMSMAMGIVTLGIPSNNASVLAREGKLGSMERYGYATSISFGPGESGCPVFDLKGRVVGICQGGDTSNQNLTFIKPITFAKDAVGTAEDLSTVQQALPKGARPIVLYAALNEGSSKTLSQQYCAERSKVLSIASTSTLSSSQGAKLTSIEVDNGKPNCVNVTATLKKPFLSGEKPGTPRGVTGAWIAVEVKASEQSSNVIEYAAMLEGTTDDVLLRQRY